MEELWGQAREEWEEERREDLWEVKALAMDGESGGGQYAKEVS